MPSLVGGGAERVFVNLANAFSRDDRYEVEFVLVKAEGIYLSELDSTVKTIDLQADGTLSSLFGLIDYLKHAEPDILLSGLAHVNLVSVFARILCNSMKTKLFISEHNTLSLHSQQAISLKDRLLPLFAKVFYPLADGVIAVSQAVAKDLQKVSPDALIRTIYNPILSADLFEKLSQSRQAVQENVSKDRKLILSIGRLEEVKDFSTLIKAFKLVQEKMPAELWILGEGSERTRLESLIQELGLADVVRLPGFIKDLYQYLTKADLFVLSSRHEALPTALIEAIACGIPTVSTDWSNSAAELSPDRIVPVGDFEQMALAILDSLSEPKRTTNPSLSIKRFLVEEVIPKYQKLFFCPKSAISSAA
ncbi:MAG: glycosyltransferase [Candidatus Caenarcaniphilales bacterium]|nr:glycosyltransferase [Candidatus Caenarcaniphilales bacterium]